MTQVHHDSAVRKISICLVRGGVSPSLCIVGPTVTLCFMTPDCPAASNCWRAARTEIR